MPIDTTASGRFWLCPVCRKHVPSRNDKCQCGFDRTTVNVPMREASVPSVSIRAQEPAVAEGGSKLPWLVGLAVAVAASLWLWKAGQESQRANADLRDRTAERLAQREQSRHQDTNGPPVVLIEQAGMRHAPESTTPEIPSVETSTPEVAANIVDSQPLARVTPEKVEHVTAESEVDIKRREGAVEFERSMAALSSKADQADVAWERYLEGCRLNVTTAVAAAGFADRTWIAWAYASTTTSQWTEACAEAGTFFGLVRQVRSGMCVAEDRARMSWVLPGTRREMRHKHRLDWDGWDRVCS